MLLAAFVAASSLIVPQKSMAGVSIGMSEAKVKSVLGAPAHVKRGSNDFGPYTELHYARMRVVFQGNAGVTGMDTTSRALRTSRGVGVGSSVWDVMQKVPKVKCEVVSGYATCHIGEFLAGRKVTDFTIRNGRVTHVTLGIVID